MKKKILIRLILHSGYDSEESNEEYSDISSHGNMDLSQEERDEVGSLKGREFAFDEAETKSQFTDYSMSSSVMRRNDQLTLLDNRFDKVSVFKLKIDRMNVQFFVYITTLIADVCRLRRYRNRGSGLRGNRGSRSSRFGYSLTIRR